MAHRKKDPNAHRCLVQNFMKIISETNGISLADTIELLLYSLRDGQEHESLRLTEEFRHLIAKFQQDEVKIQDLLEHPVAEALFEFFKNFFKIKN